MRIHAIELGWLQFPKGWTRTRGMLDMDRSVMRGPGGPMTADTNRRLRRFIDEYPTLILPSHDAEAAQNIAGWQPLRI